ncbi:hypothetical protein C8R45DRAFT_964129 [Mycena sanguinolenta]|nr:hypothetical protein C8R45DRAFT_964129 [Mycena sanguinolenta]
MVGRVYLCLYDHLVSFPVLYYLFLVSSPFFGTSCLDVVYSTAYIFIASGSGYLQGFSACDCIGFRFSPLRSGIPNFHSLRDFPGKFLG